MKIDVSLITSATRSIKSEKQYSKKPTIDEPAKPKLEDRNRMVTVLEGSHGKFQTNVDGIIKDIVIYNYQPEIIFSTRINNRWRYGKPSVAANQDIIQDLDEYWDYLFHGMTVKGFVKDNLFILDKLYLTKKVWDVYKEYIKIQSKDNRLDLLDKIDLKHRLKLLNS